MLNKHYPPIPDDDWNCAVYMEFMEREGHIFNDIHDRNNPKPVRKRLPKTVRGITLRGVVDTKEKESAGGQLFGRREW